MDMKKILQALDGVSSKPVEGSNDMKKFIQVVNEGANPHKVSLPVQMAMNHYQEESNSKPVVKKDSTTRKYFQEAEEIISQKSAERKQQLKMYAQKIAKNVLENREKRDYTSTAEGIGDTLSNAWVGAKDFLGVSSPQEIAQRPGPQGEMMKKLLAFKADPKYQSPEFQKQIDTRIKLLADRINIQGDVPADAQGNPKQVVTPDQFNTNQLR